MTWQRASILPVWVVALVGAVLVGILCEPAPGATAQPGSLIPG